MFDDIPTAMISNEESGINRQERIRIAGEELKKTIQHAILEQSRLGNFSLSMPFAEPPYVNWDKIDAFLNVVGPQLEKLGYSVRYPDCVYSTSALIEWLYPTKNYTKE